MLAVDRASPLGWPDPPLAEELSRLKALAVLAFCAEITRLPGHWLPLLVPEKATAQTTPSRSTMVAHMLLFSPLSSASTAASRAALSAAWLGNAPQSAAAGAAITAAHN